MNIRPTPDPQDVRREGQLVSVLNELEAAWRSGGAPIAESLAPGLEPAQIDDLTAADDLVVPDGLKLWWGWHNGIVPGSTSPSDLETGMTYALISLQQALEIRSTLLAEAGDPIDDLLPDVYWRESWLPVVGSAHTCLFVDAADPSATPVREKNWTWEELLTVRAGTLTEIAEAWLHVLTRGWVYRAGGPHDGWSDRPGIPLYLRKSSLI
jgi:hypothetical protein